MIGAIFALSFLQALKDDYTEMKIEGWSVHVERNILKDRPHLWEAAKNELVSAHANRAGHAGWTFSQNQDGPVLDPYGQSG